MFAQHKIQNLENLLDNKNKEGVSSDFEKSKPEASTSGLIDNTVDSAKGNRTLDAIDDSNVLFPPNYCNGKSIKKGKKRPDSQKPGLKFKSENLSENTLRNDELVTDNPNLSFHEFSYKGNYMSEGFIKLSRAFLQSDKWQNLIPNHKVILIKILELVCFQPRTFDDFGVILDLQPGELCIPIRDLADKCGVGIDRNVVERCLLKLKLLKISRHETRHRKTVITLIDPDLCAQIKYLCETMSETNSRQSRDIKEEYKKEKKEINILGETSLDNIYYVAQTEERATPAQAKPSPQKPPSADAAELLEYFNSSLQIHIKTVRKMPKSNQLQHFEELLKDYKKDEIKKAVDFSHADDFWKQHVHSPSYLKKKISQLLTCAEQKQKGNNYGKATKRPASESLGDGKSRFDKSTLNFLDFSGD